MEPIRHILPGPVGRCVTNIDFSAKLRQRREDKKIKAKQAAVPPKHHWKWTKGQQQVIHDVESLFGKEQFETYVLAGAAGTGKTTVCKELGKLLKPYYCALTHKAAAIMSDKVGQEVHTLARALNLRKVNDYDNGATQFVVGGDIDIPNRVIFIDECSMLGEDNFKLVQERLIPNHDVLFIGDRFQLPPVNEELSRVFMLDAPQLNLLEPVRFDAGSGIDRLATSVRDALRSRASRIDGVREALQEYPDVEFVDSAKASSAIIDAFKRAEHVDDVRMISFTNEHVERYNYHIKKAVTGDAERIEVGDLLMANAAYSAIVDGEETLLLQNNQSVRVNAIEDMVHLGIPAYRIKTSCGKNVFMPQDLKQYLAHVEMLKSQALKHSSKSKGRRQAFRDMFVFKDAFADLRLNYAQTVHKAQGSTYQTCFFDLARLNTESTLGRRLLYTGITRAAKRLVLFK